MTLPTFFIIGAAKAGTTSLHFYLDQHPEIQMSAVKETNFFAGPPGEYPFPVGQVESRDEYEALFDPAYAVRGEASPSYASAPRRDGVPARIKDLVPEARFVYLVRDPISRTVSQFQMLVAEGKERSSLADALAALDTADPHRFHLTCQSFYAHQIELYLEHFPRERLLVLDQADLLGDRARTLASVFSFLGVDPAYSSDVFDEVLFKGNEHRRYPGTLSRLKPALRAPYRALPEGFRESLRGRFERTFLETVPKPEVGPAERARLAELYAPDVARLRELTGLPLASWSL
ncbi:MAG TPA: sulfotransferase [Solirubrobacterales bacterium]|nr:sulfotransferase [Solirubrobacterales bacterium]